MRIRKHASKVLGTSSSQQRLSPSPSTAVDTYMMMQQAYSCEINISRWDVFPFPPLGEHSDKEEKDQENATMGRDVNKAMIMSATASHSNSSSITAEANPKEEEPAASVYESEEEDEEYSHEFKSKKKKQPNKANMGNKTITTTTIRAAGMKEDSQYIAAATYNCKKTDGKQWRCKMPVDQPNSLCDYHLDQLLSYRCSSNATRKAKWPAPARKTAASSRSRSQEKRSRTSAAATSESMYYYSAFGPWRGKQRGSEPAAAVAATVKKESEEEQLELYGSSSRGNDDNNEDDSDNDSLEEEEDSEEESKTTKLIRRRRRPVKARSLKSLL